MILRCILNYVTDMVVSVTAETRCIVQVGAVLQQLGQFLGFLRNLLVGVDKFVPLTTSPGDLIWGPRMLRY
ncbi:hypothetical protein M002_03990 [Pseudomonas aeruginosa ID4365]|nr:hypothetical protein M002_03990 [Pseudomonas aeruginosa ID4365]